MLKSKILVVAVLGMLIYSCSPKVAAPVAEVKKIETPLTPELAEGKMTFEKDCTKCHGLPEFSRHTKEQWVSVVDNMGKKAKLTEGQKTLVYNYIVANL